jgi:hypothetical protein
MVQTKLLFGGVGAVVPLGFTVAALPVVLFVGLLPITFAGMGTRDSAMLVMFFAYATQAQILAVGLLYTFFGYWLLALVGFPFVKKALQLYPARLTNGDKHTRYTLYNALWDTSASQLCPKINFLSSCPVDL